jgi:hypothetical protein
MRRGLFMLLVAALALTGALPAEAARRHAPKGFYGVMWNRAGSEAPPTEHDTEFALMARSGVETVRTVFSWAGAQPEPGATSFADTDRQVTLAAFHRLELLPVVIYTPGWAADYPDKLGSPPKAPSDYAAYLTQLVGRYGPKGSFWIEHPELPKVPIRRWQIWNEPHLVKYWYVEGGSIWSAGYTQLLIAAHAAIKRADPGATVVTAGLASFPWKYLSSIYKAGGRGAFDAVGINFFTGNPRNVIRGVRLISKELRRHHQRRKKVWLTEVTWPAAKGRAPGAMRAPWQFGWQTRPAGMADRLSELYRRALATRRRDGIGRVYWYTWATKYSGDDLFDYGGLVRWDGSSFQPQPALKAYAKSARGAQGCRKTSSGVCGGPAPVLRSITDRPPLLATPLLRCSGRSPIDLRSSLRPCSGAPVDRCHAAVLARPPVGLRSSPATSAPRQMTCSAPRHAG